MACIPRLQQRRCLRSALLGSRAASSARPWVARLSDVPPLRSERTASRWEAWPDAPAEPASRALCESARARGEVRKLVSAAREPSAILALCDTRRGALDLTTVELALQKLVHAHGRAALQPHGGRDDAAAGDRLRSLVDALCAQLVAAEHAQADGPSGSAEPAATHTSFLDRATPAGSLRGEEPAEPAAPHGERLRRLVACTQAVVALGGAQAVRARILPLLEPVARRGAHALDDESAISLLWVGTRAGAHGAPLFHSLSALLLARADGLPPRALATLAWSTAGAPLVPAARAPAVRALARAVAARARDAPAEWRVEDVTTCAAALWRARGHAGAELAVDGVNAALRALARVACPCIGDGAARAVCAPADRGGSPTDARVSQCAACPLDDARARDLVQLFQVFSWALAAARTPPPAGAHVNEHEHTLGEAADVHAHADAADGGGDSFVDVLLSLAPRIARGAARLSPGGLVTALRSAVRFASVSRRVETSRSFSTRERAAGGAHDGDERSSVTTAERSAAVHDATASVVLALSAVAARVAPNAPATALASLAQLLTDGEVLALEATARATHASSHGGPRAALEPSGLRALGEARSAIVAAADARAVTLVTGSSGATLASLAQAFAPLPMRAPALVRALSSELRARAHELAPAELISAALAMSTCAAVREPRGAAAASRAAAHAVGGARARADALDAARRGAIGASAPAAAVGAGGGANGADAGGQGGALGLFDPGALGLFDPALFVALARAATSSRCAGYDARMCARLASAFARADCYDARLFRLLARRALGGVRELSAEELRTLAWAYAHVRARAPPLFEVIASAARAHVAAGRLESAADRLHLLLSMAVHCAQAPDNAQQKALAGEVWPGLCATRATSELELVKHRLTGALLAAAGALSAERAARPRALAPDAVRLQRERKNARAENFSALLARHGWRHNAEVPAIRGTVRVDLAHEQTRVALELDGPHHFVIDLSLLPPPPLVLSARASDAPARAGPAGEPSQPAEQQPPAEQPLAYPPPSAAELRELRSAAWRHNGFTDATQRLLVGHGWAVHRLAWWQLERAAASAGGDEGLGERLAAQLLERASGAAARGAGSRAHGADARSSTVVGAEELLSGPSGGGGWADST
ncbi:hypothetical protein KFE25_005704 [Diacronema lutheri]|uniref:RAP domain-containing protein n=1 Tax=Diacronema lutheri TaxID=2081491 RepID=A0A8J5X9G6_DIALT|nr:hypothetical protein KFE25_005704 [Diacronema lutheri]